MNLLVRFACLSLACNGIPAATAYAAADTPADTGLRQGVPLVIFDARTSPVNSKYVASPAAKLLTDLTNATNACSDAPEGFSLLGNLSPRQYDSAAAGVQIAIVYPGTSPNPPTYTFTLTALNPKLESQLGELLGTLGAQPSCTAGQVKVLAK